MYISNRDYTVGIVGYPRSSTCLAPFTSEMAHEVPKVSKHLRICELVHSYICVSFCTCAMSSHVRSNSVDGDWASVVISTSQVRTGRFKDSDGQPVCTLIPVCRFLTGIKIFLLRPSSVLAILKHNICL